MCQKPKNVGYSGRILLGGESNPNEVNLAALLKNNACLHSD